MFTIRENENGCKQEGCCRVEWWFIFRAIATVPLEQKENLGNILTICYPSCICTILTSSFGIIFLVQYIIRLVAPTVVWTQVESYHHAKWVTCHADLSRMCAKTTQWPLLSCTSRTMILPVHNGVHKLPTWFDKLEESRQRCKMWAWGLGMVYPQGSKLQEPKKHIKNSLLGGAQQYSQMLL